MKLHKVFKIYSSDGYREANSSGIYQCYDATLKKMTYRVFVPRGELTNITCGRYESLEIAVVVRDIVFYLSDDGNKKKISPYYDIFTLQNIAIKRNKKDIGDLLKFLYKKYNLAKRRKANDFIMEEKIIRK